MPASGRRPEASSHRAEQLKRLDGIAAILATTAVRDAGLLALLAEDSGVSDAARSLKREMLRDPGIEPAPEEIAPAERPLTAPGRLGAAGRAAVGGLPAAGEPLSRPRLLRRRERIHPVRAAWPAGSCSARC